LLVSPPDRVTPNSLDPKIAGSKSTTKSTATSVKELNANLVGGFNPSEKYEFVSWDYYSLYMEWKNKTCPKPPTSNMMYKYVQPSMYSPQRGVYIPL